MTKHSKGQPGLPSPQITGLVQEGQEVWEEWMGQAVEDTEWRGEVSGQWRAMEQAAVRRGWIKDMERDKVTVYDRGCHPPLQLTTLHPVCGVCSSPAKIDSQPCLSPSYSLQHHLCLYWFVLPLPHSCQLPLLHYQGLH